MHAAHAAQLVDQLRDARDIVLTIPATDDDYPAGWWRSVAYRVAEQVPGLYVRYG
ncbi:hypothetical protein ACQBAU_16390 [Propionibacteriaceae bacterium Y2011]